MDKKYGRDYFIINQYLKYEQSLSDYDLTRILSLLNEKSTNKKYLAKQLGLNYEHVKQFWEFLTIKQYITEEIDTPTLPKKLNKKE